MPETNNWIEKAKSVIKKLVIICLVVIGIYPVLWMLTASLKRPAEFVTKPAYALMDGFYIQNYIDAWTRCNMATFFLNSLIATLISLIFIVIFSVTVGFAVTKMQWKYKELVEKIFMAGIMIPIATALIPLFQIYNKVNL